MCACGGGNEWVLSLRLTVHESLPSLLNHQKMIFRDIINTGLCIFSFETTYNWAIGLMSKMFVNGLGDQDSIPVWDMPKTQKMVLDAALLNSHYYKVRIKGKVDQSRKGVAPSPIHWCSSYWKGSLPGRPQLQLPTLLYKQTLKVCYTIVHPRWVGLLYIKGKGMGVRIYLF